MALATGTSAPDFTLKTKNADGLSDVTLSANYGSKKTVLLFFPLAFTSVCQNELCTMSSALDEYAGLDAVVYGISVDSPFSQEAFAKANSITVPLLSDFNKDVAKSYDVLYEDLLGFKGVAKRAAFVVDADGKIVYSWVTEDPHNLPPFDEVKAAIS
ncbi:redoxin domain-containing protein [Cerasicoccus frondis]|uniref:redoxin domain-containing protein n=1 Tax=Cerasicoccus frondis TaxID=490090 RepID=UPI002852A77E|nr:redoxin domain-containing protein [Cerasicoccus frondis]